MLVYLPFGIFILVRVNGDAPPLGREANEAFDGGLLKLGLLNPGLMPPKFKFLVEFDILFLLVLFLFNYVIYLLIVFTSFL